MLFLLLGCSDYNLFDRLDGVLGGSPSEPVEETDPEEEFQDCDAIELAPAGEVPLDCSLPFDAPERPWEWAEEWAWEGTTTNPDEHTIWTTPAVGDLDDDGIPEIVFNTCDMRMPNGGWPTCYPYTEWEDGTVVINYVGTLVVLDGQTGATKMEWYGVDVMAQVTLADIDADGTPEILTLDSEGFLVAFHPDGTQTWRSPSRASTTPWMSCVGAADLDADGMPELLVDSAIWDVPSGEWEVAFPDLPNHPRSCTVGDLDLDGEQEWILGNYVVNHRGEVEWSLGWEDFGEGSMMEWTLPVQADADPEPEVFGSGHGGFWLFDHDGSTLGMLSILDDSDSGAPCAGDFDGDGQIEVAAPARTELMLFEVTDFGVSWSIPIDDESGASGCSGFDFDGDGALEILFGDHDTWRVIDGRDGSVRIEDDGRASGTGLETPVVADVDGDGAAEVVLVNANYGDFFEGWKGLRVLGNVDDMWPPAGPTWSSNDFSVTNARDDLSVPSQPDHSWDLGVYRARPAADPVGDLHLELTDVCLESCDANAELSLSVQVSNEGLKSVDRAIVSLYRIEGEQEILLRTAEFDHVPSGQALEGVLFDGLRLFHVGDGLVLRVESTDAECELFDQQVVWNNPCQ